MDDCSHSLILILVGELVRVLAKVLVDALGLGPPLVSVNQFILLVTAANEDTAKDFDAVASGGLWRKIAIRSSA